MQKIHVINSVIREYGCKWLANRLLYSAKLKLLNKLPFTEKYFEYKTAYPKRTDLFRINTKELKRFIQKLDKADKEILTATADNCVKGIIDGFSSIKLHYGNPVNWQLNPLSGKRCDITKKWFQIPDFDPERGDIKITWEASRFSHFITLARAYLLTGKAKYYAAFSQQLTSWLKDNPYGYGANFKCGQECSIRMVNALLAYTIFKNEGVAAEKEENNIKELIDRCYRKVLSNFFYAYKCIKNNHTISELMGMIVGAWCCEDENQLKKAFHLLDEVIEEQFTDDGGYRQLSFNYQRLALQDLECILSISPVVGLSLCEKSKAKIQKAALLMYQCQDDSGDVPNYGSNDGALVFPLTSCGYRDFRPTINAVYALLTSKQLYSNGKHQEELLWLAGNNQLSKYKKEVVNRISSQFKDAGVYTLRNSNSWAMIVLNRYTSRPNHMDQLHMDLWIDGVNVLCDSGTYSYASELGKNLSKSNGHNTVTVGNKEQMNTYGPFLTYDWTEGRTGLCNDAQFEGTVISKNGYTHTRKVEKKNNSYIITDYVDGNEAYQVLFHTPCDVMCNVNEATLLHDGKVLCVIRSTGQLQLSESKRSLYYLKVESIHSIIVSGTHYERVDRYKRVIETEIMIPEHNTQ